MYAGIHPNQQNNTAPIASTIGLVSALSLSSFFPSNLQAGYSFDYPTNQGVLLYTTILASLGSLAYACKEDKLPCPTQHDYAWTENTFNLMVGRDHTIQHYRLALGANWQRPLYESPNWLFAGRTEVNLTHWQSTLDNPLVKSGQIIGIMPLHQLIYRGWKNWRPMLEFGVGPQLMTSHIIENKQKSTQFQFSDTIGLGVQIKQFELGYRFTHYSNANIKTPNYGFDTQNIYLSYQF